MYESFYGLREKPFTLLPDPDYLYLSPKHQRALTLLEYGLMNQAGFSVICGDAGAGKTTLIRRLLIDLGDDTKIGLITNTHQSFGSLLNWVLMAFGIDAEDKSKPQMHQMFVEYLIEQYAHNKRTILIVDEAQNMDVSTLEELRMLSNINADKDQVLQVILVGQLALRDTLRKPELMQFAQRIAVDYYLESLNEIETELYILHRLKVAGAKHQIFTPDASKAIFQFSGGTPRLINLLADTALVYGFAEQVSEIDEQLITEVVTEQHHNSVIPTFNTSSLNTKSRAEQIEQRKTKSAESIDDVVNKAQMASAATHESITPSATIETPIENKKSATDTDTEKANQEDNPEVDATVLASSIQHKAEQHTSSALADSKTESSDHTEPADTKQTLDNTDTQIEYAAREAATLELEAANQTLLEQQIKLQAKLDAAEKREQDELTTTAAKAKEDKSKSDASIKNDFDEVYPIIQIDEKPKNNLSSLAIGLFGGAIFSVILLMVAGYFFIDTLQPQAPTSQYSNTALKQQAEIEQLRIEAMQKERDAALAISHAMERERDAAIATAKIQNEIRQAEKRAAELVAEQERKADIAVRIANKRARDAEKATARAKEAERIARIKENTAKEKLRNEESQQKTELKRQRQLESTQAEQRRKAIAEQNRLKESTIKPQNFNNIKSQIAANKRKQEAQTAAPKKPTKVGFSTNPCDGPKAKFLSTCKR